MSKQTPIVVSYLRFSRPEQLKGDSIRRQLSLSEKWAASHGLTIDSNISDKGISAFRGKNATVGALGSFLKLVEGGRIGKGSTLLVESLDRLSRTEVLNAFQQFIGIVNAGIKIVTLGDGREYELSTLNANFSELMYSLMVMSRAHEESAVKSQRLSAAWVGKRKRIGDKYLTAMIPAWCEIKNGKIVLDKTKALIVKWIFKLSRQGYGLTAITKKLNADAENFARVKHFNRSYVHKILKSRAVLGEFQPHKNVWIGNKKTREPIGEPITAYYPRVVSDAEFYAASGKLTAKRKTGGRSGKFVNLFGGLLIHSKDKSALQIQDKGYGRRYVSSAAILGRKDASAFCGFPVSAFEEAILVRLADPSMFTSDDPKEDIQGEIEATKGQIVEMDAKIERVQESMIDGNAKADSVVALLAKMDQRKSELQSTLKIQMEKQAVSTGGDTVEQMLAMIQKSVSGKFNDTDERIKLRSALRAVIEKIECWFRREGRDYLCAAIIRMRDGTGCNFSFTATYVEQMRRDAKGHPIKSERKDPLYQISMSDDAMNFVAGSK